MTISRILRRPLECFTLIVVIFFFTFKGQSVEKDSNDDVIEGLRKLVKQQAELIKNLQNGVVRSHDTDAASFNDASHDDPRLIAHLRSVIHPPSTLPYNLSFPQRLHHSQYGQSQVMDSLLKKMTGGFFIEVGANEGERFSNSLFFERERGWSGLLIEADPDAFAVLDSRNRKAHHIHSCLSTTQSPSTVKFFQAGKLGTMGHISRDGKGVTVQCYPLYSLLLALGVTRVDYFSLDIEGDELKVLKTLPWDRVEFRVLDVEVNHIKEGEEAVKEFMASVGYTLLKKHAIDLIFVKQSLLDEID